MKRYGSIYLIKNTINNKCYIGQTINPVQKRWKAHIKTRKSLISKAIRKYGKACFIFEELVTCFNRDTLNDLEKYFIAKYDCLNPKGYNQTSGGNDVTYDKKTLLKMKLAKLNKPSKCHIVPILARNINTSEEKVFSSFKEAEKELNISRSSILKSCKYGIIRKNFLFSYVDANQSGSTEVKISGHAQRLEGESVKAEYNPSTSPRFPNKYEENKKVILNYWNSGKTPHAISKILNLDKSMLSYFIHSYGKKDSPIPSESSARR